MADRVRTHTRRDPRTGRKTTVHQHTRRGQRRYGPNLHHAGRVGKRGWMHARRGRKGKAAICALIVLAEVVLYVVLNGTAFLALLIAGVLVMLSVVLSGRSPR